MFKREVGMQRKVIGVQKSNWSAGCLAIEVNNNNLTNMPWVLIIARKMKFEDSLSSISWLSARPLSRRL